MTSPGFSCKLSMYSLVAFPFGTAPGSVSIVLRWEVSASTAKQLNMVPLITEYQKSLEGSSITKVTTKSA